MVENAEGGDVTFLITNPSFEQGMKGWTIPVSTEGVDVKTATEANISNRKRAVAFNATALSFLRSREGYY